VGTPVGCIQAGYSKAAALSACCSRVITDAILQIFEGIAPPKEFSSKCRYFKMKVNSPKDDGISPVKLFLLRSSNLAKLRDPSEDGIGPVNIFLYAVKCNK
jgi:hypothetical protein